MAKLGLNIKFRVTNKDRSKLKEVMLGVFEAKLKMSNERFDIFDLGGASIGAELLSDELAVSVAQARDTGTWLEFIVDDPARTKRALEEVGVKPFEYDDKKHDYYQLPGGQVVRVAAQA